MNRIILTILILTSLVTSPSPAAETISKQRDETQSVIEGYTQKLIKVYQHINSNWNYPEKNTTTVQTSPSWDVLNVNTSNGWTSMARWNPLKQEKFSLALNEITSSKLIMECSNAARIARLALLGLILGDNALMTKLSQVTEQLKVKGLNTEFNVASQLSWSFYSKVSSLKEGEFYAIAFTNIPQYNQLKCSFDANHNVIRLANGLFIGFAPDFFTEPRTEKELLTYLYTKFTEKKDLIPGKEKEHEEFCRELSFETFVKQRQAHQLKLGYFAFSLDEAVKYSKETNEKLLKAKDEHNL
jgi:hypothetical protein